jgi:pilus assembly protein Flp/PilA
MKLKLPASWYCAAGCQKKNSKKPVSFSANDLISETKSDRLYLTFQICKAFIGYNFRNHKIVSESRFKGGDFMKPDMEKGQGLTEYALILVLVVVIVIVAVALIGPQVGRMFSNVVVLL